MHRYTFDSCYQFKILVCAHASHHINLFQLHSVLLDSANHIERKHLTEEQDGAQENRGDILVLRWAVILLLAAPQHRLLWYKVHMFDRISVRFSTLWSNGHFRQWEKRDKWWLYNTCTCMWPIWKSQLLRLIIMTKDNIYTCIYIYFEAMTSRISYMQK